MVQGYSNYDSGGLCGVCIWIVGAIKKSEMKRIFPAILILILLTQCKLGEPYSRSEDLPVESFRIESVAGESIANMPWWELFGDSVLLDLIDQPIVSCKSLLDGWL